MNQPIHTTLEELLTATIKLLHLPEIPIRLERPQNESHGDYSTNIALTLFSQIKQKNQDTAYTSPRKLAETIRESLQHNNNEFIEKVEVAGPGFINFFLKKEALIKVIEQINLENSNFGTHDTNKSKTVIVEYSSPNIAKPFTIGHLRSTIIGDAIANILEATGWQVLRDNHLGDWGTQFGKQIYAIKEWGKLEEIEKSKNPVKDLVFLYVKFHEEAEKNPQIVDEARLWFKKLEEGDGEARSIWKKCIDLSWKEFNRIYKELQVKHSDVFDEGRGLGESFFEDKMKDVITEMEQKNLIKTGKEGARLFFFEHDKYPPAMILKKDGTTLYHTRDLATDKYRMDTFKPDLIINEVGAEQTLYFQQLFEMERVLGWFAPGQRIHVGHGLVRFKDKKMSTRKGEVIWLDEVLLQAKIKARNMRIKQAKPKGLPETSDKESLDLSLITSTDNMVAVGALKWNDLKGSSFRDIVFDWDEVLNMKGNSGPYLQYTHARCCSVIQKASNVPMPEVYEMNEEEYAVSRWLERYPDVVAKAGEQLTPHLICTYLYELSQRYNTFYNKHSILGSDKRTVSDSQKGFRQGITCATAHVLHNGLNLLGIEAPESM